MASAESAMDDSFKTRVEKIFGSLAPSQSSPWTLTDDAVEKREWKRDEKKESPDRDDETPCSSSFDELLRKNRRRSFGRELDDGDGDGGEGDGDGRDEWEIRSSIGLDKTLDNEEEEDEFDKVALGRENAGERLYMNEVNDRGPYLNMHNVLPKSLTGAGKDPRANRQAARIRLKEGETEARGMNSIRPDNDTQVKDPHVNLSKQSGPLKPILKRKENNEGSKPQKRVRFDPACKIDCDETAEQSKYSSNGTAASNTTDLDSATHLGKDASKVPDYIRNPSKYTCYSFDATSEVNEESNIKAAMDFLKAAKSSNPEQIASHDPPKSVTFVPRKKADNVLLVSGDTEMKENKKNEGENSSRSGFPSSIAAGENQENEDGAFGETEPETEATDDNAVSNKPCRQYRKPSRSDDS